MWFQLTFKKASFTVALSLCSISPLCGNTAQPESLAAEFSQTHWLIFKRLENTNSTKAKTNRVVLELNKIPKFFFIISII